MDNKSTLDLSQNVVLNPTLDKKDVTFKQPPVLTKEEAKQVPNIKKGIKDFGNNLVGATASTLDAAGLGIGALAIAGSNTITDEIKQYAGILKDTPLRQTFSENLARARKPIDFLENKGSKTANIGGEVIGFFAGTGLLKPVITVSGKALGKVFAKRQIGKLAEQKLVEKEIIKAQTDEAFQTVRKFGKGFPKAADSNKAVESEKAFTKSNEEAITKAQTELDALNKELKATPISDTEKIQRLQNRIDLREQALTDLKTPKPITSADVNVLDNEAVKKNISNVRNALKNVREADFERIQAEIEDIKVTRDEAIQKLRDTSTPNVDNGLKIKRLEKTTQEQIDALNAIQDKATQELIDARRNLTNSINDVIDKEGLQINKATQTEKLVTGELDKLTKEIFDKFKKIIDANGKVITKIEGKISRRELAGKTITNLGFISLYSGLTTLSQTDDFTDAKFSALVAAGAVGVSPFLLPLTKLAHKTIKNISVKSATVLLGRGKTTTEIPLMQLNFVRKRLKAIPVLEEAFNRFDKEVQKAADDPKIKKVFRVVLRGFIKSGGLATFFALLSPNFNVFDVIKTAGEVKLISEAILLINDPPLFLKKLATISGGPKLISVLKNSAIVKKHGGTIYTAVALTIIAELAIQNKKGNRFAKTGLKSKTTNRFAKIGLLKPKTTNRFESNKEQSVPFDMSPNTKISKTNRFKDIQKKVKPTKDPNALVLPTNRFNNLNK